MFMGASGGVVYDTNAQTYMNAVISAGGSLTTGQKTGINRWFLDMKGTANGSYATQNIYSQIVVAYLYTQGVSATRDAINAVTPGTFNGTDTASPTYNSSNLTVAFNGTTQYTDTTFTPNGESVTFTNSNFTAMVIHRVDTNNDTNATVGEVGGGNSYMQIANNQASMIMSSSTAFSGLRSETVNHLWGQSWADSGHLNAYDNGSNFKANTTSWGNTSTRSVFIGAFNSSSPGFGGASTVDHFMQLKGAISDANQLMFYNAGKALKVALGGTAWL